MLFVFLDYFIIVISFCPVKNIWEDKEFKNDILIDNKKRGDQ